MSQRIFLIISGAILIAGGFLAFLLPLAASFTATLIFGWTLVLAGILHAVGGYRSEDDRWWHVGFGVLGALLGLSFVFFPVSGMLSLTLLLGAMFAAVGALQLYLAWKRRARDSVWMLAISGLFSCAIAVLVAFNPLEAAAILPGVMLAIELISTGVALLLLRPVPQKTETDTDDSATSGLTT